MNLDVIAGPAIGAIIGYCTNYIAVKMLFRPLRPVQIKGMTLPFTPGILPKGKKRLGKAIGEVIGTTLLTKEDLTKTMLSDEIKQKISEKIREIQQENESNPASVGELIKKYTGESAYESGKDKLKQVITGKITDKAVELSVGTIIAQEAVKAVKEKVTGTFLAMMANDQLLNSFVSPISERIDRYILENGYQVLEPHVQGEIDKISARTVGEATEFLTNDHINIEEIVVGIYEEFVQSHLGTVLEEINISSIVEKKIIEMDVLELEKLFLSIMKKELNAVVNLGALIGFLLGLFNLLF